MRRRILLLTVGMTTLVVLAFAIPLMFLVRSAIVQRNERSALDDAKTIGLYLRSSNPDVQALGDYVDSLNADSPTSTTVTLADGTVIGATPVTGIAPQPTAYPNGTRPTRAPFDGFQGRPDNSTLRDVAGGGQVAEIEGFSTGIGGRIVVQVYLSPSARTDGLGAWLLLLGGVSIGLLAVSAAGAEVLTRRIVRPLTRTAAVAHELSQGDLAARAPTRGPREVAEVGTALNRLAGRIGELISEERETVADLSHRLRTPLTALRLEAESLSSPAEAERIGDRVSVLERTLTNVIRAARRQQREGLVPAADATAVVQERVDFWTALAEDQDRVVTRDLPTVPLMVRCAPEDLAAAVDALLENVFAHTPEGAALSISLRAAAGSAAAAGGDAGGDAGAGGDASSDGDASPVGDAGEDGAGDAGGFGAVLEVCDDGPGFSSDAAMRGRSDRGSSGLGLDIARHTAEASGGAMTIGAGEAGRGARITLTLGPPLPV